MLLSVELCLCTQKIGQCGWNSMQIVHVGLRFLYLIRLIDQVSSSIDERVSANRRLDQTYSAFTQRQSVNETPITLDYQECYTFGTQLKRKHLTRSWLSFSSIWKNISKLIKNCTIEHSKTTKLLLDSEDLSEDDTLSLITVPYYGRRKIHLYRNYNKQSHDNWQIMWKNSKIRILLHVLRSNIVW